MPKLSSNAHSICAMIGTGALCATLALTPIMADLATNNNVAHAAGGYSCVSKVPMSSSWENVQISSENYTDISNSAQKVKGLDNFITLRTAFETAMDGMDTISDTLVTEAKAAGALDDFSDPSQLGGGHYGYLAVIKAVTETSNYDTNTELQAAVARAEGAYTQLIEGFRNTITTTIPSLNVGNATDIDSLWSSVVDYYGEDNYSDYFNLMSIFPLLNEEITSSGLGYKYYAYELVCSATRLDPDFRVNYVVSTNPFENTSTGDNTGGNTGNKPTTPTQPIIIESNDKNVKVSGININVNYTLNVNAVSTDNLKLTGDNFKNSLNQAFYDIYIQDEHGNRVGDTGKVQVSIKLPSNMSVNSDFVVYYVPTGDNGEHLTNQAQAIKGVKVSKDGWLTFETDHFSVYGIVEYTKGKAPNTGVVAHNENSATTAGAKITAGVVSILSVVGVGIVAHRQILRRRNNQK